MVTVNHALLPCRTLVSCSTKHHSPGAGRFIEDTDKRESQAKMLTGGESNMECGSVSHSCAGRGDRSSSTAAASATCKGLLSNMFGFECLLS